jgi:hypothetical protein
MWTRPFFLSVIFLTALASVFAQDEVDITKEVADPQTYIFSNGNTTVQGYIYSMLAKQTSCCDKDDIYLEVKIDPNGYVLDAIARTGKYECYKMSVVDIVRNVRWKPSDNQSIRQIFFPVKPLKPCTGEEGENQYKPIPVTNNPVNNKVQVASNRSTSQGDNSMANEYAQREREKKEREEANQRAREEAERKAQEEAQRKMEEMMAEKNKANETPAAEPIASNDKPKETPETVKTEEEEDATILNKFALESDEERLAREAAEAKALKEEEARLLAEAEAESKKAAEAKAKKQAELKSKKEAELKNKKSANEQEMRARLEAELREQIKSELEAELKKNTSPVAVKETENSEEEESTERTAPTSTSKPAPNKFSKYPGYESSGEKSPDPSHRGSHVNARVPEFTTPQFIEQSGTSLYIKNKLKESGVCGLAQAVGEVTVDKGGSVISHRIFKTNTDKVEAIIPGIFTGMRFKPESIRYNGQIVYIEFKADIFCPSTPTKGIDLDQVQDYLQVNR